MIPKFLVDVMLGSLSRWLRLFGFDTKYRNDLKDIELIRISLQEDRILITKDTALSKSKKIKKVLFIKSEELQSQLIEVLLYLRENKYEIFSLLPRCPLCNGLLENANKEDLRTELPNHIYFNVSDFYLCKSCGKIYWQGSHKEKIDLIRKKVFERVIRDF